MLLKQFMLAGVLLCFASACTRSPKLYLHDDSEIDIEVPVVALELEIYWDYIFEYEVTYDWRAYWFYGWDEEDERIFGPIGYQQPSVFNLRRYHTGDDPSAPHTTILSDKIYGYSHEASYSAGYWDMLVWNDITTTDGVQSLIFEETPDMVTAYTNRTLNRVGPRANDDLCYYQPEELFSAYEEDLLVSPSMEGFEFDEERNVWVKRLNMTLEPLSYIYLPQIILHHNNGRVDNVDGNASLTGMASRVNINNGITGLDGITVYHNVRMKKHLDKDGEDVDIIGGKLLTFGMCGLNPNRVRRTDPDIADSHEHLLRVNFLFNNGEESTLSWDVSKQIRELYKGGVITVHVDCDTLTIPQKPHGSGFDAVVEDMEDGGTHEFEF